MYGIELKCDFLCKAAIFESEVCGMNCW